MTLSDCLTVLSTRVGLCTHVSHSAWRIPMCSRTSYPRYTFPLPHTRFMIISATQVPLKNFFPDYTGGADVKEAIKYVRSRFRRANRAKLPIHFMFVSAPLGFLTSLNSLYPDPSSDYHQILGIVKDATPDDTFRKARFCSAAIRALRLRRMCSAIYPISISACLGGPPAAMYLNPLHRKLYLDSCVYEQMGRVY